MVPTTSSFEVEERKLRKTEGLPRRAPVTEEGLPTFLHSFPYNPLHSLVVNVQCNQVVEFTTGKLDESQQCGTPIRGIKA